MIHKVRHGVFETNSSSTHAISIAEAPTFNDTLHVESDGRVVIRTDEFGWEWTRNTDAATKASYLATHLSAKKGQEPYSGKDCRDGQTEIFETVIKDHTGATEVVVVGNGCSYRPNGYIDHQSVGTANKALESYDACKTFLFSTSSVLFTGNDNSDNPYGKEFEDASDMPEWMRES